MTSAGVRPKRSGRKQDTHVRPYISDMGARKSGPMAKVTRKTLSVAATSVSLVML